MLPDCASTSVTSVSLSSDSSAARFIHSLNQPNANLSKPPRQNQKCRSYGGVSSYKKTAKFQKYLHRNVRYRKKCEPFAYLACIS
jgi:hypothetical protein